MERKRRSLTTPKATGMKTATPRAMNKVAKPRVAKADEPKMAMNKVAKPRVAKQPQAMNKVAKPRKKTY